MDEETFTRLAERWHDETGALSSPDDIRGHPAYQQIIAAGEGVLPYIFHDLQENGGDWYGALRAITGTSPVITPDMVGRFSLIRAAWIAWGREHGHIA